MVVCEIKKNKLIVLYSMLAHFSVLEGLVTRDCRIDLNGTVTVS